MVCEKYEREQRKKNREIFKHSNTENSIVIIKDYHIKEYSKCIKYMMIDLKMSK